MRKRGILYAIALLLLLIAAWTLLAPEEATLSTTIRWVYLHVAFTWAGSSMINLAGLMGVVILVWPRKAAAEWLYPIEISAVALYAIGFLLSLVSSWASWGGVLWQEPRVIGSLVMICFGVAALLTLRHVEQVRLAGLVALVFMLLLGFQVSATRVIFHPESAIDTSESAAIKSTFYGLTVLALAVGVSLVLYLGPARPPGQSSATMVTADPEGES